MVYNKLNFHEIDFSEYYVQSTTLPDPTVIIEFNGSGIHEIAGPTPQVTFSTSYNRSAVGQLDSIERKINLEGQIVRSPNRNFTPNVNPDSTGVKGLIGAHEALSELFSECSAGTLEIFCNGESFFEKHNVKVDSIEFNSSENNFIQVAEYTVSLSYTEPGAHGFNVKNTNDQWNIEPLEDYVHLNMTIDAGGKDELHNPPRDEFGQGRNNPITNANLVLETVPRYKISRKLSAVGLPPTGTPGCTDAGVNSAYTEAKAWVESKLITAFDGSNNANNILNSGLPAFVESPDYNQFTDTFLYNHVRTTEYSVSEGSYGVNESWLAMPTGINYIENYDIDVATDDSFIKTVTVKGEIEGVYYRSMSVLTGDSGLVPDSGNVIDISPSNQMESKNNVTDNKYENALSGFMSKVKPFLYQRANLGLNNRYYTDYWLDETTSVGSKKIGQPLPVGNAPQIRNPTYVKEQDLNIIPISTSEAHMPQKGSISYNYQFNNKPNIATGILSSNISVDTNFPTDVFAEAFVLGRALGPVLQDLGTVTSAKKNINIEVKVIPPRDINGYQMSNPSCPLWTGGNIYQTITGVADSLKPYGDQPAHLGYKNPNLNRAGQVFTSNDTENWNPIDGSFSLQRSYTYQPCNIAESFRT